MGDPLLCTQYRPLGRGVRDLMCDGNSSRISGFGEVGSGPACKRESTLWL